MTEIIYSVKRELYEEGFVFVRPNDIANSMYIIEIGKVEIYTYFEGNKFEMETLESGTIINHRALLM